MASYPFTSMAIIHHLLKQGYDYSYISQGMGISIADIKKILMGKSQISANSLLSFSKFANYDAGDIILDAVPHQLLDSESLQRLQKNQKIKNILKTK